MSDNITVTGLVATTPRYVTTSNGVQIISFRLASSQRRYDEALGRWIDGDTNWYTISGFGQLAENCVESINKGDRVVVVGKLRLRTWENNDRGGMTAEIESDVIAQDLNWGVASYKRVTPKELVNA
jgi:single-strand DNA-binding protein